MKKMLYRGMLAIVGFPLAFVCFLFVSIKLFDGVPLGGFAPDVGRMVSALAPDYEASYGSVVLNFYGDDIVFDVHDVSLSSHDGSFMVSVPRVRVLFDVEAALSGVWRARGAYMEGMRLQMSTHEAEIIFVQLLLSLTRSAGVDGGLGTMGPIVLGLFDTHLVVENEEAGYRLRTYIQELRFRNDQDSLGQGLLRANVYAERCRGYRGESLPEGALSLRYALQADTQHEGWRLFRFWLETLQVEDLRACLPQGEKALLAAGAVDDVTGAIALSFDEQLAPQRLSVDVGGRVSNLQMPRYYGDVPMGSQQGNQPAFESFAVHVDVDVAAQHAVLQRGFIGLTSGGGAVVSGEFYRQAEGYRAPILISFESVDFSTLGNLWPDGLGNKARVWVLGHIPRGYVDYAQIHLDMAVSVAQDIDVRVNQFDGDMTFRALEVNYLEGMPRAQAVDGVAHYDDKSMILDISKGTVEDVLLDGSRVSLLDLDSDDEQAEIALRVDGSVASLLGVLDHPPLNALDALGLTGEITGRLSGQVFFDFPLLTDLSFEQLAVSAKGNVYRLRLKQVTDAIDVRGDGLALTLDEQGMVLSGGALVGDVYVRGSYDERFNDDASYKRAYHGEGVLSPQDWQNLVGGATDMTSWLGGYTGFSYDQTVGMDGESVIFARFDLTDNTLRLPFLRWRKEATIDASLSMEARIGSEGVSVDRIHFSSDDSDVTASLFEKDENGAALTRGIIKQGVIGDNRFDVMWRHLADDLSLFVSARSLHLEPLSDALSAFEFVDGGEDTETQESQQETTLGVRVQIARAAFGEKKDDWLRDARAQFKWSGETMDDFKFLAHTGHEDTFYRHSWVRNDLPDKEGNPTMKLRSENFGSFLGTLGLYDGVAGGVLRLEGTHKDDRWGGNFSLRDWRLKDTPLLSRLSSLVSVSGLMNFLMLDSGLDFEEGYGVFDSSAGTLSIEDSFFWGDSLGLSLSGKVHWADRRLDVAGTLLPSYTLNNFLGRIPVLGELAGGDDSHFLGVPYRAVGTLGDDVDFRVEAGESLAPPILRGLWDLLPSFQSR